MGNTSRWKMHHIHREFWNANSLSPGDVNGDGFTDYAVVHEMWDGDKSTFTITLHPGPGGDIRKPWQKITVFESEDTFLEYCDFGDFDGDGNLDVVGVNGPESAPSIEVSSGVRIVWGPGSKRISDRTAWIDSGLMPQSLDRGHHLYVKSFDINGDGAMDIVFGGRQHQRNKRNAGIGWIEAPKQKADRRDLSKWIIHDIDADTPGGHGFVFADIDQDGDMDIADNNADWNTSDEDEKTLWYENPGIGTAAQKQQWKQHIIHRGPEYYSKTQVDVGDVDGDGLTDLVVQAGDEKYPRRVYLFRKLKRSPGANDWQRIEVPKPYATDWLARPLRLADINGDGKLDIVGGLIHDAKGNLPPDKAAVFWMEYRGDKPAADNWVTHVIKWSDGLNTGTNERGEKWDHLHFLDMDGDGDLDIIANAEEHQTADRGTIVGEAWFENPSRRSSK